MPIIVQLNEMENIRINSIRNLSREKYLVNQYEIGFERNLETSSINRIVVERGHGAAILLVNKAKEKIILIKQFRTPVFVNEGKDGFLIEVCAGIIENEDSYSTILREVEEETGYQISKPEKVFEAYMSPGILTEMIDLYIGYYDSSMKISDGGGLEAESEWITVLEFNLIDALQMMKKGEIKDAKTIILLQYAELHLMNSKK